MQADGDAEDEAINVSFPANGWGTKLDESLFFTPAQIGSQIASSIPEKSKTVITIRCRRDYVKPKRFWRTSITGQSADFKY